MAYAYTITDNPVNRGGIVYSVITVVETDVGVADKWELPAPLFGRITGRIVELTDADLASTITPTLGTTDGGNDLQVSAGTSSSPAAGSTPQPFITTDDTLYGASGVDAHANTVTTTLIIERG